jgi:hypothetical protein
MQASPRRAATAPVTVDGPPEKEEHGGLGFSSRSVSAGERRAKTSRIATLADRWETLDERAAPMGLVELLFTVCSIIHPTECRNEHLQFIDQGSLAQCMNQAQPYLAEWSTEHQNLRIVKWRCAYPDTDDKAL